MVKKIHKSNPFVAQYELEHIRKYADGFDVSAFSKADLVNIVLQRSRVLYDIPKSGKIIVAWTHGNAAPMAAAVDKLGDVIVRRAIADNYAEYLAMRPIFEKINPKKIADIGAGYGIMDVIIAKELGADCLLIDIESNDKRHFGFTEEGAAYSDLAIAYKFASANGVGDKIQTINPEKEDLSKHEGFDLITSYLSCGFHYPFSTYWQFYYESLAENGALIFDQMAVEREQTEDLLKNQAKVEDIWTALRYARMFVQVNGRLQPISISG